MPDSEAQSLRTLADVHARLIHRITTDDDDDSRPDGIWKRLWRAAGFRVRDKRESELAPEQIWTRLGRAMEDSDHDIDAKRPAARGDLFITAEDYANPGREKRES